MEEKATPLRCYSRLRQILSQRKMTVMELRRALARKGVRVDPKTLYRLTDPTAEIERLDTQIAGSICTVLGVDLARLLEFESERRKIGLRRLTGLRQRRLDALLERQAAGRLTGRERAELEGLVEEAERLTLANARVLSRARETAGKS